jgi:hypothetical protein
MDDAGAHDRTPSVSDYCVGYFAMTAGCGSIRSSGGDAPIVTQISATPYGGAPCFYSDKSGTDRIVGGRIVHWCGPKPRAVF